MMGPGKRIIQTATLSLSLCLFFWGCHSRSAGTHENDGGGWDGSGLPDAAALPDSRADRPMDPTPDGQATEDGQVLTDGAPVQDSALPDGCAPHYTSINSLTMDTSGGHTGQGDTDYHLSGDVLTLSGPYLPNPCTVTLTPAQLDTLLAAAQHVDWASVAYSYIPPDNPNCCCDQFIYVMNGSLSLCGGGSVSFYTTFCDESFSMGDFPAGLGDFIQALRQIGSQVFPGC